MILKRKKLSVFLTVVCLFAAFSFKAYAETPLDSYTYWTDAGSDRKSVYNKAMYTVDSVISAKDIGVDTFSKVSGICTDGNGNIYILDSDSRIVVLDKKLRLMRELREIGGERYDNAKSIYVYSDNIIYICDTEGKRIICCTVYGELLEIIKQPQSPLIPKDFNFAPTKLVLDSYGYMYVLSDGSYLGALLYSPEKEFMGFYGANNSKTTVTAVFSNIKNRLFPSNEKKANSVKTLPYCFVDITIDDDGFVYTCNGYTDSSGQSGQIRKLGQGTGKDILNSSSVNFVDDRISNIRYKPFHHQSLCALTVDSDGFIYALESRYGKIFVYDETCRTVTVFGGGMGEGTQKSTFQSVSGIALLDNAQNVLVSDSATNLITVFKINEYGKEVKRLINETVDGNYEKAKDGWEKVLAEDNNFQPAYRGLAYAAIEQENYTLALDYAKKGYDREAYAIAFEYVRTDFFNKNFGWIFAAFIFIIVGFLTLLVLSTKNKLALIKNREIKLMLSVPFHPSQSFELIKQKNQGSIVLCGLLVLLFYITTVLQTLAGGFMFTVYDKANFNSLWILVRTAGFVLLFIAADWMVCTLLGASGKVKELAIVICYSLTPLIVEGIIHLVLTNILLPSEAEFLSIFDAVAVIWFVILVAAGLIKVHDFGAARLVGTTLLAVFAMAAIIMLIIIIFILSQQFCGFIATIISELLTL